MSTGELERREPVGDRELALLLGGEFGLGTLEQVSRSRDFPRHVAWGGLLGSQSMMRDIKGPSRGAKYPA